MAISRDKMTQSVNGKVTRTPKEEASEGRFFWWKSKDDPVQMGLEINSTVKAILKFYSSRQEKLNKGTRLYGSQVGMSPFGVTSGSKTKAPPIMSDRVSFNLVSSVVDTLVSKIAKNKVVPTFITSGGTWGQQRRAENLSKFLDGAFYEQKVHPKGVYAFRDGAIWGDGLVYIYADHNDRVAVERALPHEFIVDPFEAAQGNPRQLHRMRPIDRDLLRGMFQDDAEALEAIDTAEAPTPEQTGSEGTAADLVMVTASWHLPSYDGAEDGVYAFSVGDKVLDVTTWDKDYFPFPHFTYNKDLFGFWGTGAAERLSSLQTEINRLMILDQTSRRMMGSFKVLIEKGSKITTQSLNNDVGTIVEFTGTPPSYVTPPAIDPSNEAKLDSLIAKGFQQEGVSQLAASSMKPTGVNSGAALRTFDQIAEDRQLFIGQQMEEFYLEVGRQMIEVVKDIYKRKGSYDVNFPNTTFMETIDWKDVKLDEDEYTLKAFPTSSLPDEPMSKLATVQEYAQAGWISPRAAKRLMSMPDVEMSDKLANAAENLIHKAIEDILYDGTESQPDQYWDLNLAKSISMEWMNYAMLNNCPESKLKKLRDFMTYIDVGLGLTAPEPTPDQGQPGGTAPAAPEAPPTSNLIPNVNGVSA